MSLAWQHSEKRPSLFNQCRVWFMHMSSLSSSHTLSYLFTLVSFKTTDAVGSLWQRTETWSNLHILNYNATLIKLSVICWWYHKSSRGGWAHLHPSGPRITNGSLWTWRALRRQMLVTNLPKKCCKQTNKREIKLAMCPFSPEGPSFPGWPCELLTEIWLLLGIMTTSTYIQQWAL